MPRISSTDVAWLTLIFRQVVFHVSLYGFYFSFALSSILIILQKGLKNSPARIGLLISTLIMLALSTAYVVIFVLFYEYQFPTLTSEPIPDNPPWLYDKVHPLQDVQLVLRRTSYLLSDMMVVWRTWCIYFDNVWVRAYLILVILATAATSITTAVLELTNNPFHLGPDSFNLLGSFCLLLTNFSTTVLCAYKVWHYRRFIKVAYGVGRKKTTLVERVLIILVESGAIYCIFWLLFMLKNFDSAWKGEWGLELWMPHFSGLYTSVIILIVALSKTSQETFFSAVDRDLESYPQPEANFRTGPIKQGMQFALPPQLNSTTLRTDGTATDASSSAQTEDEDLADGGRRHRSGGALY